MAEMPGIGPDEGRAPSTRPFDTPDENVQERRSGIRLRATLNMCVVQVNLAWTNAWSGGTFEPGTPFHDHVRQLVLDVQALRDEVAGRIPRPAPEPLRARASLPAALLHAAALELDAHRTGSLLAVSLRTEDLARRAVGRSAGIGSTFQMACIHARRYVMLASGSEPLVKQAMMARDAALRELARAVTGSTHAKKWARTDPAFKHLLDEREFHLLLGDPGGPVRIPFRAPFGTPPPEPVERAEG